jgi:hypothetical protein
MVQPNKSGGNKCFSAERSVRKHIPLFPSEGVKQGAFFFFYKRLVNEVLYLRRRWVVETLVGYDPTRSISNVTTA